MDADTLVKEVTDSLKLGKRGAYWPSERSCLNCSLERVTVVGVSVDDASDDMESLRSRYIRYQQRIARDKAKKVTQEAINKETEAKKAADLKKMREQIERNKAINAFFPTFMENMKEFDNDPEVIRIHTEREAKWQAKLAAARAERGN